MGKNYDYALALIENEVRNDCEYYVYSQLRDVVDGLENDNEALTRLLKDALEKKYSKEDELQVENAKLRELVRDMYQYATNREMELCNACVEADGDHADCAACDEYDGACGIAKRRFEELYSDRMRGLETEAS